MTPSDALTALQERMRNATGSVDTTSGDFALLAKDALSLVAQIVEEPIPMVLYCPACGLQHVDAPEPEKGWTNPPHRSHLCHGCGATWRPADRPTAGVAAIQTAGASDTYRAMVKCQCEAWVACRDEAKALREDKERLHRELREARARCVHCGGPHNRHEACVARWEAAEALVYVPGLRKCAKCGCQVTSNHLNYPAGTITANNEPQDCPNGCGPMWPVTERQAGNDLCERIGQLQEARDSCRHTANAERDEEIAQLRKMVAAANDGVLHDVGLWSIMRVWSEESHARKMATRDLQTRLAQVEQRLVEIWNSEPDFIHSDPEIQGGAWVFQGTRLPVSCVLEMLSARETFAAVRGEYKNATPERLAAALRIASKLAALATTGTAEGTR